MKTELTVQALERAIENDELLLYYQPKISLSDGKVIGGEALVRWNVGKAILFTPVFLFLWLNHLACYMILLCVYWTKSSKPQAQ